ncbi:MAG: hypothetical protein IPP88_22205 [Betaproteobacteria bacterium]|nr:hypothetical protein [Betaproteobacteria bacterium]
MTFTSNNANCTIASTTLTAAPAGGCTVTATKAADTNYNQATATVAVTTSLNAQTITLRLQLRPPPLAVRNHTPTATATSGLTVAFTIAPGSASVCSISTGIISFLTAGTCTIQANQAGNGNYSAAPQITQTVTVTGGVNLNALSAFSRKTHGPAGPFDLLIDDAQSIGGAVTVEPRAIGTGHTIVFTFSGTVSATGSATTPVGSAAVSAGTASNEVIVTLTGVPDAQRATVSLSGVNGTTSKSVSLGFLIGDVNNSRNVTQTDVSSVKARSGQPANASNFLMDLNATGVIGSADIAATKARISRSLP